MTVRTPTPLRGPLDVEETTPWKLLAGALAGAAVGYFAGKYTCRLHYGVKAKVGAARAKVGAARAKVGAAKAQMKARVASAARVASGR